MASVPTDYKCGYLPRELTLKRGERQKLIFWNDRYGNTGCGVFKGEGGTKLERFLHKNQHIQRKLLNYEFWINGHHFTNKVI